MILLPRKLYIKAPEYFPVHTPTQCVECDVIFVMQDILGFWQIRETWKSDRPFVTICINRWHHNTVSQLPFYAPSFPDKAASLFGRSANDPQSLCLTSAFLDFMHMAPSNKSMTFKASNASYIHFLEAPTMPCLVHNYLPYPSSILRNDDKSVTSPH